MYVKVENGEAREYTRADLRADYPHVSFPPRPSSAQLAALSIYPVTTVPKPDETETTKVTGYTFSGSGSDWTQVWTVEPKTPEEVAEWRDRLDQEADIQALKSDPQVRQLLRARPGQINNYIDNNVTDLASAKAILKIYGRALAVLAHTIVN